ncbi:hypothetical protein DVH24_020722 [Malus domestica]|uniref:RING-type domain-containing protein n=1 Tax=Malus domestica TaxID=3750 RepID=A0A498J7E0_MALDO|nr:hypothetical protein DVH24_020722 [Malus domestica]
MTEVCSKLRVSRSSAIILLRHCNWNVSMLFDKWFEEEDDVRNKLGLFRKVPLVDRSVGSFTCEICFETCDASGDHSISSHFCGHFYCIACWAAYVNISKKKGVKGMIEILLLPLAVTAAALNAGDEGVEGDRVVVVECRSEVNFWLYLINTPLKCPHPGCSAAVGEYLILSVLATKANGDTDKAKYSRYLLRSYVEDSKAISNRRVQRAIGSKIALKPSPTEG